MGMEAQSVGVKYSTELEIGKKLYLVGESDFKYTCKLFINEHQTSFESMWCFAIDLKRCRRIWG